MHAACLELVPHHEGIARREAELPDDGPRDGRKHVRDDFGRPALEGADTHDRRMGGPWLFERSIVLAFSIAAGSERLPSDPRARGSSPSSPLTARDERPRDDVEVDADALAECADLHDRHPATVDHPGFAVVACQAFLLGGLRVATKSRLPTRS